METRFTLAFFSHSYSLLMYGWISVVALIACGPIALAAQGPIQPETIERIANITTEAGGLVVKVDLGTQEAGAKLTIQLTILNDSGIPFPIEKMETACNCLKVKSRRSEIPGVGELVLDINLDVPLETDSAKQVNFFTIMYEKDQGITVFLEYRIAGLVSFKNARALHVYMPSDVVTHQFEIPILVTSPSQISKLEFKADGLETEITPVESDDQQLLRCTTTVALESRKSKVGRIEMIDSVTKKKSAIFVVIEVNQPLTVVPTVMRFGRSIEPTEPKHVSRCLVRFPAAIEGRASIENVNWKFKPAIKIKVETQKIGDGLFRCDLVLDEPLDKSRFKDTALAGICSIEWNGQVYSKEVVLLVDF